MSEINSEIIFDSEDFEGEPQSIGDVLGGVGRAQSPLDGVVKQREEIMDTQKVIETPQDHHNRPLEERSKEDVSVSRQTDKIQVEGVVGITVLVPYIMYFSLSNSDEVVGVPGFIDVENKKFVTLDGKDLSEELDTTKAKNEIYKFISNYCQTIEFYNKAQQAQQSGPKK